MKDVNGAEMTAEQEQQFTVEAVQMLREIRHQVAEIHSFIGMLSGALDSPMLKAMMPASIRNAIKKS